MSEQTYCYCPAALQELRGAREACVQAAQLLRQRDPEHDAREALKAATAELQRCRELLQRVLGGADLLEQLRQVPELVQRASGALETAEGVAAVAKLARIEAVMPAVERIESISRQLDRVRDVRVVHARAS